MKSDLVQKEMQPLNQIKETLAQLQLQVREEAALNRELEGQLANARSECLRFRQEREVRFHDDELPIQAYLATLSDCNVHKC